MDSIEKIRNPVNKILHLTGEINTESVACLANDIIMANNEKEIDTIMLYINSIGGCIEDGVALISAIKTSNIPIIAMVYNAESMATVVALACDAVVTYPYTVFMIHQLAYGHDGNIRHHKKEIEIADFRQKQMDTIISNNSKLTMEQLQKWYDIGNDVHIYGDKIIEYGMTNKIMEVTGNRDLTFIGNKGDEK